MLCGGHLVSCERLGSPLRSSSTCEPLLDEPISLQAQCYAALTASKVNFSFCGLTPHKISPSAEMGQAGGD